MRPALRRLSFAGLSGNGRSRRFAAAADAMRDLLDHIEADRYEEDGDERGGKHSANDGGAENAARNRARALRAPQRNAAQDEREGGHQDGPQTDAGAGERGFFDALAALFVFALGEFDNQDRVLGGEADEHDETDLRVDVVIEVAQPEKQIGAEDGDGRAEQNAEGQRPAFVLRG